MEVAQKNIVDHTTAQRKRKSRVVSEYAVMARSIIHKKFQLLRESAVAQRVLEEEKAAEKAKLERVKDPEPSSTYSLKKTQNTHSSVATEANGKIIGLKIIVFCTVNLPHPHSLETSKLAEIPF